MVIWGLPGQRLVRSTFYPSWARWKSVKKNTKNEISPKQPNRTGWNSKYVLPNTPSNKIQLRANGTFGRQCARSGEGCSQDTKTPPRKKATTLGGSTSKGEKIKVKKLKGALSNPIPLVKRSSEQFLFLRLHVWKALPSIFSTSMGISMGKWPKSKNGQKSLFEVRFGFLRCLFGGFVGGFGL